MQGKIDMGHGRALLALPAARQIATANLVAHKQLSVRETERLVARELAAPEKKTKSTAGKASRDILRLQEEVAQKLGANVNIKPGKKGAGTVVIHYTSLDQLDGILAHLGKR